MRTLFIAIALAHLALGLWMAAAPHSFFTTIGSFGTYNRHYERDVSTYVLALAAGAGIAAWRPAWRIPVLAVLTIQYVLHAANHLFDIGHSDNGWAGPVDFASLTLAAVQFALLLWLLARPRGVRA